MVDEPCIAATSPYVIYRKGSASIQCEKYKLSLVPGVPRLAGKLLSFESAVGIPKLLHFECGNTEEQSVPHG